MPCRLSKSPVNVTKSQPAWPFWIWAVAVAEVGRNERAAQQRLQKFFHRRLGLDHAQGMNDLAVLQPVLNRVETAARRHFTFKNQLLVVGVFEGKRGDAGAAGSCSR